MTLADASHLRIPKQAWMLVKDPVDVYLDLTRDPYRVLRVRPDALTENLCESLLQLRENGTSPPQRFDQGVFCVLCVSVYVCVHACA